MLCAPFCSQPTKPNLLQPLLSDPSAPLPHQSSLLSNLPADRYTPPKSLHHWGQACIVMDRLSTQQKSS